MEVGIRPSLHICFKGFELNPDTRELYRRGLRVKLHGQPIDVLTILAEHAGEMVTRESLKKSLWPQDTFVDFEHSLNSAINRLREALDDSADAPRFIETIPRRGYRFVAPIDPAVASAGDPAAGPAKVLNIRPTDIPAVAPAGTGVLARLAGAVRKISASLRMHWVPVAISCGAVLAMAAIASWYVHQPLPAPRITSSVQVTYGSSEKNVAGVVGTKLFLNLWDQEMIARMPISGGAITQIEVRLPGNGNEATGLPGHGPWLLDVSPNGSKLLVRDHGDARIPEIWVTTLSGDEAHYLGKANEAAWSPDGANVVYATLRKEIYQAAAEGGEPQLLADLNAKGTNYALIQGLSYSPDGRKIRFTRGRELWEMDATGSNLHQLLVNWHPSAWKCCGRWTADGAFYVFLSGDSALRAPLFLPGAQLWAIDERRGHWRPPAAAPIQLAANSMYWGAPIPAREGHTIFARGVAPRSELVRYDIQSQKFQPFLGGISAEFVDFSRDGNYIAYVSYPDGILWKANRDGSARVQLTDSSIYPKLIRWSPDGTRILYTDFSQEGIEAAYVVSAQGGTPMRVLPEDTRPQQDANWSPDGSKIVFSARSSAAIGQVLQQELRILDLGSHVITSIPDSDGMTAPRWSPDGRYIAALSMDGSDLVIFNMQTQQWTTLVADDYPLSPVWTKDGQAIYFVQYQDHGVYRVEVSSRRVERVAELKDFRHAGWYNVWLGRDEEDAPLLLREMGSDEIFQLTIE